ncbi:hypothetical protein ABID82_006558 [Methylobacterium sp. PvP062]|uniref:Uncharacterized protein n=1 Tax=Methylobacterium radiotolerans TaxID=31998 RepID=A0ABV2NTW2_9HYPH|nr:MULTISPECIES: hypothetical protein [unclassified Methylobacterium]MBP2498987.1 hypothetical protein [Methylobacterium sp. PvP105]MBP2505513.1 hypothetical protein [Methylobacterium sp. PvP109]
MPINPRQLTASLLAADHIAERQTIAAFVADAATRPAPNPFPETSVGAVIQVWRQRAAEFQSFSVEEAGLTCLLATLSDLSLDEPLMQEILRAGPHTANVFHRGDGCRIVGAVLYGKPGVALPVLPLPRAKRPGTAPRSRARVTPGQLDLFTQAGT